MVDKYPDFAALFAAETGGVDYRIDTKERDGDRLVMAPHGGGIEPGTSQIAGAIAGEDRSLYLFEGVKRRNNYPDLHITSDRYDEPRAVALAMRADRIVAVHGRKDNQPEGRDGVTTWVGGRDLGRKQDVVDALKQAGFEAIVANVKMKELERGNICNRGRSGEGVQLEIPKSLRDRLVKDDDLMGRYAAAVRRGSA